MINLVVTYFTHYTIAINRLSSGIKKLLLRAGAHHPYLLNERKLEGERTQLHSASQNTFCVLKRQNLRVCCRPFDDPFFKRCGKPLEVSSRQGSCVLVKCSAGWCVNIRLTKITRCNTRRSSGNLGNLAHSVQNTGFL